MGPGGVTAGGVMVGGWSCSRWSLVAGMGGVAAGGVVGGVVGGVTAGVELLWLISELGSAVYTCKLVENEVNVEVD